MTTTRTSLAIAAIVTLGIAGELTHHSPFMLGGRDADAIIGRPLTPMSYAGVARRTTRRAVYAGAYAHPYVAPVGAVATLPAGCARAAGPAGVYYACGAARYAPVYDGPTLVYQPM